ncbi:MAG: hypothetical protein OEY33_03680, partial [Bdellovibrionales bacterium]|nr:hypothetical protein [Bdellovibrionales bacterium]
FYILPTALLYWLDPIYTKMSDNQFGDVHYSLVFYLVCWLYIKMTFSPEQTWLRDSASDKV